MFLQHRDELFAYALVLAQDPHVAEDVFQEVGVSIVQEEAKGADPDNFLPWCRSILRHRVADFFRGEARHRKRHQHFDDLAEIIEMAFAEGDDDPIADEMLARMPHLQHCLETLSPKARAIITDRYHGNQDLPAIAESHGWKVNAVKVGLSKARKHLRDCVERQQRLTRPPTVEPAP